MLQGAAPELPLLLRTAPERQNHRQSDFSFPEIIADILAELSRGSTVVERVVDELECDAEIQAVAAACCNLRLGPLPEQGADFRRGAEQSGCLGANHRKVIVLAGFSILRGGKLHDLAFGDDGGGGGENVETRERANLDHHLEGLAEEKIADENARLIAPQHARRELAPAHVALVHDIVVK